MLEVDGRDVRGLSPEETESCLIGEMGTDVRISFQRQGKIFVVDLARCISSSSVSGDSYLAHRVSSAIAAVRSFQETLMDLRLQNLQSSVAEAFFRSQLKSSLQSQALLQELSKRNEEMLNESLAISQDSLSQCRQQVYKLERELADSRSESDEQREEIVRLESGSETLKTSIVLLKHSHEKEICHLRELLSTSEYRIKEKDSTLSALEIERANLIDKEQSLENEVQVLSEEISLLKKKLDSCNKLVAERGNRITELELTLVAEKNSYTALQQTFEDEKVKNDDIVSAVRAEIREREARINDLDLEIEKLRSNLANQKSKSAELEYQLDASKQSEMLFREQSKINESKLREDLKNWQENCNEGRTRVKSMQQELDALSNLLKLRDQEISSLSLRLATATEVEENLRDKLDQADARLSAEIARFEQIISEKGVEIDTQYEKLEAQGRVLVQRDEEILDLQAKLALAGKSEAALRSMMEENGIAFQEERAKLKESIEELNARIQEKEHTAEALNSQLDVLEQQKSFLNEQITELQSQLDMLKSNEMSLRDLLVRNDEAHGKALKASNSRSDEKDAQIEQLGHDIRELKEQLQNASKGKKEIDKMVNALNDEIVAKGRSIKSLEDDLDGLKKLLADRDALIKDLKGQVVSARSEASNADKALKASQLQCVEKDKAIKSLQEEQAGLKRLLSERDTLIKDLKGQLSSAGNESADTEKALRACKTQCADKDNKIKSLQDEMTGLKKLLADRDAQIKDLKDKAASESADAEKALKVCKVQCAEKDKTIKSLQDELAGLRRQLTVLEEQLGDCRAHCGEKDSLIKSLQDRLDIALQLARQEIVPKPSTPRQLAASPMPPPDLVGVGIRLTDVPPHRVVELVAGGPAALAGGVRVGDLLVEVAGRDVSALPMSAIRRLIVGPSGSAVTMAFVRDGHGAGEQHSGAGVGDGGRYVVEMVRGQARQ